MPAASRSGAKAAGVSTAGKTAAATPAASTTSQGQQQQPQRGREEGPDPDHDPLRDDRYRGAPRGPARGPPGYGVGAEEDWVPGRWREWRHGLWCGAGAARMESWACEPAARCVAEGFVAWGSSHVRGCAVAYECMAAIYVTGVPYVVGGLATRLLLLAGGVPRPPGMGGGLMLPGGGGGFAGGGGMLVGPDNPIFAGGLRARMTRTGTDALFHSPRFPANGQCVAVGPEICPIP